MTTGVRIAMWSGPRNISTALLRSWGNRPDTVVHDEPLYAHYLKATGVRHPGADEVIAAGPVDWREAVGSLVGPLPAGKTISYQKHMAHHLLPEIDRGWLSELTHCFLIRDPGEMLTSLIRHMPRPALEDTGLPQQVQIFEGLGGRGTVRPAVIDARDVLENPEGMLRALCSRLGVPFHRAMLEWPAGPRSTDGVWGKHWYDGVYRSTGFKPYRPKDEDVPPELGDLHRRCLEHYEFLRRHRLSPE